MWVAYCSRECQGKDWNDHKDKCKKRETRIKANAKKAFQEIGIPWQDPEVKMKEMVTKKFCNRNHIIRSSSEEKILDKWRHVPNIAKEYRQV